MFCIDLSIFNGPRASLSRNRLMQVPLGQAMLSGLVATLCSFRTRADNLGSALRASPRGLGMSISPTRVSSPASLLPSVLSS